MVQGIGESGADCYRCGEPTIQVGADAATVGVWCRACDLVALLPYHDIYLGEHSARPWEPDEPGQEWESYLSPG